MMHKKILLIEDDVAIAEMYKIKLKDNGFTVSISSNGEDALSIIKEEKPDLILLDIMMPVMNGDEMLEKLRQTEWGANIRVIILTNISRDEAPRRLSLLSVDRYIVKAHHTPQQVLDIIREVLGEK